MLVFQNAARHSLMYLLLEMASQVSASHKLREVTRHLVAKVSTAAIATRVISLVLFLFRGTGGPVF